MRNHVRSPGVCWGGKEMGSLFNSDFQKRAAEKQAAVSSLCCELGSDRAEGDLSIFSQGAAATSKQFAGLLCISGDPTINLCRVAFSSEDLRRVLKGPAEKEKSE